MKNERKSNYMKGGGGGGKEVVVVRMLVSIFEWNYLNVILLNLLLRYLNKSGDFKKKVIFYFF